MRVDQGQSEIPIRGALLNVNGGEIPMSLPHTFKRIRMHLARSKEYPEGSSEHGYEFIAPLDSRGHIDVAHWKAHRSQCKVRRWDGDDEKHGILLHRPGGNEHAQWVFDYDTHRKDDDEAGYRFGTHVFEPGEYVTLQGENGPHTFKVVWVDNVS
jgi:hypothetical protein